MTSGVRTEENENLGEVANEEESGISLLFNERRYLPKEKTIPKGRHDKTARRGDREN